MTDFTYKTQDQKRGGSSQEKRPLEVKGPHGLHEGLSLTNKAEIVGHQGDNTNETQEDGRHLDTKLPSPAQRVGHEPAQSGAGCRCQSKYNVDVALVVTSSSDCFNESVSEKYQVIDRIRTHSMGTKSLMMIVPNAMTPPAPMPQKALAIMKLVMLLARPHHVVARANMIVEAI